MKRNKVAILIYIIIAFAAFGLISQLFGDTINFLVRILVMLGIAAALFALFYFVILRRSSPGNTDEMKKYKQAVKQSKMKYQQSPAPKKVEPTKTKKSTINRKTKKRPSHLRVIEGNKSKDKDRATF